MESTGVSAAAAKAPAARYLGCLRLQEVLVLQGSPLLGAIIALRQDAAGQMGPLALLMAANLGLVAHIFVLNDWCNLTSDLGDPNKADAVFTARGVGRREMGALAIALLVVSLLLFSRLGPAPLGIASGIAMLSGLYSLPAFNWKGRPILNSIAHLIGGVLHFLLGYSLGRAVDGAGLATASYFAVVFAAGHLTQELRDHRGDVRNRIGTNAVTFGPRRTFFASLALFTLSQTLMVALALEGTLPRPLALLVFLYPLQLWWSLQALADGLTFRSVSRLQTRYRALHAVIGLAMVAALWLA